MADEVRDYRRTRSTLGQTILIASDLSQYGGHFGVQHEIGILNEKAPDSAEIDGWEKILKVNVEYIPPLLMFYGVCDDRAMSLESVRQLIFPFAALVDFFNAILQEIREMLLQKQKIGRWGVYLADPAPTLRDIE
jgi:hypothetical protein